MGGLPRIDIAISSRVTDEDESSGSLGPKFGPCGDSKIETEADLAARRLLERTRVIPGGETGDR